MRTVYSHGLNAGSYKTTKFNMRHLKKTGIYNSQIVMKATIKIRTLV